jgi:predicted PurR-regulated permease PerM
MTTEGPQEQEVIREDWTADIDNVQNVALDDLKFIFNQAEKLLDDSIKNFDATTSKSISLITLSATLLTALAAYFFVNLDPHGNFSPKLATVMTCCIYTTAVLIQFIYIVLPKSYNPVGSFPQDLYKDHMFSDEIKNRKRDTNSTTLYLYLNEFENYNCRIVQNNRLNESRLKTFNRAAIMICSMPLVGLLVYLLLVLPELF